MISFSKSSKEYYKFEESRLRETSWSSGIKDLLGFLENLSKHAWLYEPEQKTDKLDFKIRRDNLSILRGGEELLKLRINPTKGDPRKGELDVFIDTPSDEMAFDNVDVHKSEGIYSYGKIVACTWHGCYINHGQMFPVINLRGFRKTNQSKCLYTINTILFCV